MKKRLISLILVATMILSLNVVAFACPGNGGGADPVCCNCGLSPFMAPIPLPCTIECPEDDQGQDYDQDQP